MKPGDTIHLGDGAYLLFTGYSFELRANHHENPTDTVHLEVRAMEQLIREVFKVLPGLKEKLT